MMISDYYVIGGCVLYIILVGVCAYYCSNYKNKCEEEEEYSLINV